MTGWARVVFRLCCTVSAVLLFDQAVFAGQFLGGSFGALQTHRTNATVAGIAVLCTAAAGLVVRLRGGPGWPALACLGLFGLIALQILVGFRRMLTVHIPLGVAIILLMIVLTRWAWRSPGPVDVRADAANPDVDRARDADPDREQARDADRVAVRAADGEAGGSR
jgi:hypothetical protein